MADVIAWAKIKDAKDAVLEALTNVQGGLSGTLSTMSSTLNVVKTQATNAASYANTAKSNTASLITKADAQAEVLGGMDERLLRLAALSAPTRLVTIPKTSVSGTSSSPTTLLNVTGGAGCLRGLALGNNAGIVVKVDGVAVLTFTPYSYSANYISGWYDYTSLKLGRASSSSTYDAQPFGLGLFGSGTNIQAPGTAISTPTASTQHTQEMGKKSYILCSNEPIYFSNSLQILCNGIGNASYKPDVVIAYSTV